jgi:hypothetical protein
VPALIGPGALSNFPSEQVLSGYIRAAMPYHAPSSLDEDSYSRITAFLIRQNAVFQVEVEALTDVEGQEASPGSSWLVLALTAGLVAVFIVAAVLRVYIRSGAGRKDET